MTTPEDLPARWSSATIRELCEINPKHDKSLAGETEVSFVPMAAVDDVHGTLDPTLVRRFEEVRTGFAHLAEGDVLFAKITPCMENGNAAVARDLKNGLGCATTELVVLRPRGGVVAEFLHRFLRQESYRRQARAAMTGVVGQARVPREFIEQTLIPLPPLAEQKRIVAKLEELTARSRRAKEALDAVPPLLDQLRQSILAAAFRGDLTADWRAKNPNVEPAEKLLERIRAERRSRWEAAELAKMTAKVRRVSAEDLRERYREPDVPDSSPTMHPDWACVSVEMAGDLLLGRRRAAQEYISGRDGRVDRPYLRVANVKRDSIDLNDVFWMPFSDDELALYRLEPGDIVLSEGQSPELVGQSGIYLGGIDDVCIQATVHRFRPYDFATTSGFSQLVFLNHLLTGVFRRAASLTTNIAHLTSERLRPLPFPLPPLAEQRILVERTRAALDHVETLGHALLRVRNSATKLESGLLAKAFRGELVPQDPNDEPADVLLDRLRAARRSVDADTPRRVRRSAKSDSLPLPARRDEVIDEPPAHPAVTSTARTNAPVAPLDPDTLHDEVFPALWPHGPLDKDTAVRRLADHLRTTGRVHFTRLRADGPLYAELLAAIESAAKAGHLDRPQRNHVRASKPDAATYTTDDWRHALLATLPAEPTDRVDAIRTAAEWAREQLGLQFTRLRSDGHIAEGLRGAITSAIRRGEVTRHGATAISRVAPSAPDRRS